MSILVKDRVENNLKKLSWEELDWLEKKCQEYKAQAKGPKVYKNKEAARELNNYFQSTFEKHHGY
jgi:mRNA-degrading endonuclease RelE of RelBE toxin-antitoxin system